ncbi:MAG: protein kinase [Caldilineaceae bacterium]
MSEILLATDCQGKTVVFKIACVQQRSRADANRRAIHNSVVWLQQLRDHTGIAQLQPILRKGHSPQRPRFRAWGAPPSFTATLPDWPDNPDFLITEYLSGGTLSSFVGKRPLSVDLALSLTYDLARTLAYLHERHCVHRDLKPENILFRDTPTRTAKPGELQPVLIDFGVAARTGEPKLVCGSRLWMAPELQDAYAKSLLPVDPTWDVYALGLICCYLLSGIRPRRRQYDYQDYADYQERVFAFLEEEAATAEAEWQQIIHTLRKLLVRTLHQDPQQRPTAAELADAMAALLTSMGVTLPNRQAHMAPMGQWLAHAPIYRHLAGATLVVIILVALVFMLLRVRLPGGGALQQAGAVITIPAASPTTITQAPVTLAFAQAAGPPLRSATATLLPTRELTKAVREAPEQKLRSTTRTTIDLPPPTLATPRQQLIATPPPTLAQLVANTTAPTPTLARLAADASVAPPTLVQSSPPTMTPTATPTATPTETPTATATVLPPTPTRPRSTPQRQPTVATPNEIRLLAPQPDVASDQERVEFTWATTGTTLPPNHCYELVFWDPAKTHDKRSPIGASRTAKGIVNLNKLRESPDPLLRALARDPQGFAWGVRTVSCANPQTVLQDVSEARHYTYQP